MSFAFILSFAFPNLGPILDCSVPGPCRCSSCFSRKPLAQELLQIFSKGWASSNPSLLCLRNRWFPLILCPLHLTCHLTFQEFTKPFPLIAYQAETLFSATKTPVGGFLVLSSLTLPLTSPNKYFITSFLFVNASGLPFYKLHVWLTLPEFSNQNKIRQKKTMF